VVTKRAVRADLALLSELIVRGPKPSWAWRSAIRLLNKLQYGLRLLRKGVLGRKSAAPSLECFFQLIDFFQK
jgi:hypothetical protein